MISDLCRLSRDHASEAVSKLMDKFGYEIKDATLDQKTEAARRLSAHCQQKTEGRITTVK